MRKLFILLVLIGLGSFGYVTYQNYVAQQQVASSYSVATSPEYVIAESPSKWDNLQSVLGASISNAVATGTEWVNDATGGAAEPIINRAWGNFQEELKELPREQVERIKYDFCKGIIDSYESTKSQEE